MDAFSQTHQSELFNNNETVALAVVNADPDPAKIGTYQWSGQDQVYSSGGWVFFSGLDAADIARLYESNPDTNKFTNSDNTSVNSLQALTVGAIPQGNGAGSLTASAFKQVAASPGMPEMVKSSLPVQLPGGGALVLDNWDISNGGSSFIATELASNRTFFPVAYENTSAGSSTAWREQFGAFATTPAAVGAVETFNAPQIQFNLINVGRGTATQYTFKVPAGAPAVTDCNIQIRFQSHTHNPPVFDYKRSQPSNTGFTLPANTGGTPMDAPVNLPVPAFFADGVEIFVTITAGTGQNLQIMGQTIGGITFPYVAVLGQPSVLTPIADTSDTVKSVASGGSNVSVSTANRVATVTVTQAQADWNQATTTAPDFIKNKPTIPAGQVQSNWNQTDNTQPSFIQNKPTIPAAQIQSDWTQTNTSALDFIKNKPAIPTGGQPVILFFADPSSALSSVAVKSAFPTANMVTSWDAAQVTTLTTDYTTSAGAKFVYFAIPSAETISALGVSTNSGSTWTNLTPTFRFNIDYAGTNYNVYTSAASFTFPATAYRLRFTTAQALVSGITYTGATPANQELIVGTGSAATAQRAGISLVGGRIPNTSIGVNSVQLTGAIQLDNQNDWQTYRFRRLQFTGSGNHVRGIQTLPYLSGAAAGQRPWLQVGDWIEVMNIGGTGNYNCQIQTHDVGEYLTGTLTGNGPTIPVSQTAVYRITYTGSNTNWLVSAGVSGTSGESAGTIPYTPWLPQDDGTGIYTANDVEIRAGMQLLTQQYSAVGSAASISLNQCEFTFTGHVGAAQFFKYLSNDPAFPFVAINQAVPSMDATAALAYLDGTVLNTSYASGVTIQPDGTGLLTQITYVSAGIMQCRLVMADVTNLAIGAQLRIGGAVNSLNNGDFAIQGFTDFGGYTIVQYANANASVDLDAGDTTYNVAFAAPVLFWRVVLAAQGTQWVARCQFGLNTSFSILAELDTNWFTPGSGHVSWLDNVYQEVVSGQGGNLHTDADIHAGGNVAAAGNMVLAGRNLANATAPVNQGDSIYYDTTAATWKIGAPRICRLPVPQTVLSAGNQWQVLTYDGTGLSMQFPRFAGFPVSRLDTVQQADGVRFDNNLQSWVNSRTQGSVMSRRQSVGQSVPNATDVRVSFDTGDSAQALNSGDVGLTYDSTVNVGRFTNTSGRRILVQVNFQVAWSGGYTNGIRFAWIRWNGSAGNRVGYSGIGPVPVTNEITVNNGCGIVGLDANQFFEVWCYQITGTTLTTGASGGGADAGYANRIQITRLNP